MKRKKGAFYGSLISCAVLFVLVQGQVANAEVVKYESATKVNANGTIEFKEETDENVPSPENPDKPVIPDDINKNSGDFKLVYVSNFDFGIQEKDVMGVEAFSKGVEVADVGSESVKRKVVPFVTTKDMRVDRAKGWTLTANASKFADGTHVIDGAYMTLIGANYADGDATNNTNKPDVASASIKLTPEEATLVASTIPGNQGLGLYSLALGTQLDENSLTPGVKFNLPKNTPVNADTYKSDIVWTLAPRI